MSTHEQWTQTSAQSTEVLGQARAVQSTEAAHRGAAAPIAMAPKKRPWSRAGSSAASRAARGPRAPAAGERAWRHPSKLRAPPPWLPPPRPPRSRLPPLHARRADTGHRRPLRAGRRARRRRPLPRPRPRRRRATRRAWRAATSTMPLKVRRRTRVRRKRPARGAQSAGGNDGREHVDALEDGRRHGR